MEFAIWYNEFIAVQPQTHATTWKGNLLYEWENKQNSSSKTGWEKVTWY